MKRLKWRKSLSIALVSGLLTSFLCGAGQPAEAYNWGYSPYTGSASWLSLARVLGYPLNRYSGYNAPYYLANSLVWNATYAATQGIDGRRRQYVIGQYQDPEPYYNPRTRTRPLSSGTYVADQVVYAQGGPAQGFQPAPPVTAPGQPPAPLVVPSAPAGSAASPGAGGPAPQAIAQAQPPAPRPASAPLAQGFIDLVNSKYEGNISRALFDPQTRSYARAVGLIDGDSIFGADLGEDRLQLIRTILADGAEDPLTKVATVRMLLKH